ncbi:MAG: hypothetical protein K2X74_23300 [Acetobacteraceae bacterium]|nr:hypothetical protein [Acetobacteraceae bacterium]
MIDRLRAACMVPVGPLRLVEGAAEWAALDAPPPLAKMPAAYVLPLGASPGPNGLVNATRQRVEETVAVVLVTSKLTDARGAAAASTIEDAWQAVRAALVGWTPGSGPGGGAPDPVWEPTLLGPAALLDFTDGVLAWRETYTSAYQLRGNP